MTGSRHRALLWTPRVLALLLGAYLSLFALDAFDGGAGIVRALPAFGIHLTPVIVLLLVVIVGWRWEWVGALAFACVAVLYAFWARTHPTWIAAISGPLLLVAILYLQGWMHHDELHGAT